MSTTTGKHDSRQTQQQVSAKAGERDCMPAQLHASMTVKVGVVSGGGSGGGRSGFGAVRGKCGSGGGGIGFGAGSGKCGSGGGGSDEGNGVKD